MDHDEVISQINDLLTRDDMPDTAMDVSMLDGFFASAAVGPLPLELDDLLPWVWDMNNGDAQAANADPVRAQELRALLQQHWDTVRAQLADAPERYEPVIFLSEDDEDPDAPAVSVIDEWCWGFMLGLRMQPEAFEQLPDAMRELLTPIALYGSEDGWEQLDRIQITPEQHEEIAESLPAIVAALYAEFHA